MVFRPPNPALLRPLSRRVAAALAVFAAFSGSAGPRVARAAPDEALPDITEVPDAPSGDEPASEDDPMLQRAMEAYKRGTANFNAGNFEAALADYTEAASLYASPDFQYNIARCYEELTKYEEAVRAFSAYLRAKPFAPDRPTVEQRIKLLTKLAEEQAAARENNGGKTTVIVREVEEDPIEKHRRMAKPLIISGAVLAGLGGAVALGGGIGFGVVANARSKDLDAIQTGGNPDNGTFADAQTLQDEGTRFELLQIVTVASGGAVAVVGAILLGVGFKYKNAPPKAALVPRLGPGQAGFSLVGRF